MTKVILFLLITFSVSAQTQERNLQLASEKINKSLPEVYDRVTKLMRTTVENNNIFYHFIVDANSEEYASALPKVKAQVLSTICSKAQERTILQTYNSNIVYKYENVKGVSLGEFMVKSDFCPKK